MTATNVKTERRIPAWDMVVTTSEGETFTAFTWLGNVEAGKRDAVREGRRFGYDIVEVEARETYVVRT